MLDIAVLTAGERGKKLTEILCSNDEYGYNVIEIVDVRFELWGKFYNINDINIPIHSPGRAVNDYKKRKIHKFLMPSLDEDSNNKIYELLKKHNVIAEDIMYVNNRFFMEQLSYENGRYCMNLYDKRDELDTIELHVADHCNLNCKNCSMFCGLVDKEVFSNFEQTKKSFTKLRSIFSHIKRIRIIGGEPFLNKELDKYISMIRNFYSYSEIRIITNGILVRNMDASLKNCIKNNSAVIVITPYPSFADQIEDVVTFLRNNKIRFEIAEPVIRFQKIYDANGQSDPNVAHKMCHWRGSCATLYDGKISPCFVPFVLPYLAKQFDLSIEKSGILNLSDDLSAERIRDFFNTPFTVCKYCAPHGYTAEWEKCDKGSKNRLSDWSI